MEISGLLSHQTGAFQSPALRQITQAVQRVNGVNLGQGVCNLPAPDVVLEAAQAEVREGNNKYTHPRGLPALRQAIAGKLLRHNGIEADPEENILVTAGATGAFETVCGVLINPGDEVIVFEPSYPYHLQALRRYGAEVRIVQLVSPDWAIDWDALRAALTPKTKLVLVNTPGNPHGRVWTRADFLLLAGLLQGTSTLVVTDEIYEYMVFDGRTHVSPASMPELADRTITMGGYSKTFSITGWRIGYAVVPTGLGAPFSQFLDAVYACSPTPLQAAVATGIRELPDEFYAQMNANYQAKRDHFAHGLQKLGFLPLVPEGAYYMICDMSGVFPGSDSQTIAYRLIDQSGVGGVPSSDFVRDWKHAPWLRFCLAQEDDVLDDALDRLNRFVNG